LSLCLTKNNVMKPYRKWRYSSTQPYSGH